MRKRIVLIVSIFSLVASMLLWNMTDTLAKSETHTPLTPFSDTVGKSYEKAVLTLNMLDILNGREDNTFEPDSDITRAEMTVILLRLSGYDNPQQTDTLFSDVPSDHWASGIIQRAFELGYVSGKTTDTFEPDANVTYAEAVTMLVRLLGYSVIAQNHGGYPGGYIAQASNIGLLKGVNTREGNIPRWAVAQMTYNALNVELMEYTLGNNGKYEKTTDTILSKVFDLKEVEGIVTETTHSSLTDSDYEGIPDGSIAISGVRYEYEYNCDEWLGYHVKAYVSNGDDTRVRVLIPQKTETIVLSAKDIDTYDNYQYELDGRKKYRVDKSFSFVYNGKAYNDYNSADMIPQSGYVTLIDNDSDGYYEVVSITEYKFIKVSSINQIEGIIYGDINLFPKGINTGEDSEYFEFYTITSKSTEQSSFDAIELNDVLACSVSKNGTIGKIYNLKNVINGTVTRIDNDNICIDNTEYRVTEKFLEKYPNLVGNKGRFTLSPQNEIVYFKNADESEYRYGYLVNVAYDDGPEEYFIKMLTEKDGLVTYGLSKNYSIDRVKAKRTEDFKYRFMSGEGTARQLVKYNVNEKNEIINIDTAENAKNIGDMEFKVGNNLLRYSDQEETKLAKQNDGALILASASITNSPIVFVVPKINETATDYNCFTTTKSWFANDNNYVVSTYDMNENGCFEALEVQYNQEIEDKYDNYSTIAVVSDYHYCVPDDKYDDASYHQYTLLYAGKYSTYFVKEDVPITKDGGEQISKGDIVKFKVRDGLISKIDCFFDSSEMEFTSNHTQPKRDTIHQAASGIFQCKIYKRYGTYCYVCVKNGKYDYTMPNLKGIELNGAYYYEVDRDSKIVKPVYDIDMYDYVGAGDDATEMVVNTRYGKPVAVVIYKGGNN